MADEDPRQPDLVDITENPTWEHIFRCPKCGMTSVTGIAEGTGVGILVDLKTKLHLGCCRCGWKWIEDTLDKRGQKDVGKI